MTEVVRITGNTGFINGAANVIPLGANYRANATQGATQLYIYNSSNGSAQTVLLSNSLGTFSFAVPPLMAVQINKVSSDTVQCSSNSSNGILVVNPIARSPS